MSKNITIVTSFFDIGRKNFKDIPRSNEKYLEFFKFWARIKNNLVVYTDSAMAEEVKKIRDEFGLLDKTKVIIIDDISTIENDLFKKMQEVEKSKTFINFRYKEDSTENIALYDYAVLLKTWCINDAVNKGLVKDLAAWIDFGFNHGGKIYTNPLEFDFEWKYDFPSDKITCFVLDKNDKKSTLYYLQSQCDNFIGGTFIVPKKLANKLWELSKNSMCSLVDCDFIDDDQVIMMMAYRKEPEIFNLIESDWFISIKEYGGNHLSIKNNDVKISIKDKLLKNYRINKRNKLYLKRFKKQFFKKNLD